MCWRVTLLLLSGLNSLVSGVIQINTNCNYVENVSGKQYWIYSPKYPEKYPAGVSCQWEAIAPTNSRITLNCTNFSLPPSENCQEDVLLVSSTGNTGLTDGHRYCGQGTFTQRSEKNKMTIGLYTPYFSNGGTFLCSLTSTEETTPPPATCDCGWKKETRIVNGKETGVNEYPMMVALVDYQLKTLFCGATIISPRYCLTAAHCLVNKQPQYTGVLVGEHDITTGDDTDATRLITAKSFKAHQEYNTVTEENDIALVEMNATLQFSLEVGPACIPFRFANSNYMGYVVDLLGWGTTEFAGPMSDVLLETQVDVISINYCKQTFGNKVSDKQVCTYRNGTDACQADSGGPLLWGGPGNRMFLLGIISYGKQCANEYPGVNTRVASYIDWIIDHTPDAQYCIR